MKLETRKENRIHISDLAKNLNVANEIILNWEKEFKISSNEINPIEYTYEEAKKFKTIKKLLHKKKFSIEQTKEFLINNQAVKTEIESINENKLPTELIEQLINFRSKLIEFKKRI